MTRHPTNVTLTRHPPEHGATTPPDLVPAGCCCCCCCCCLHTLGGLGGAVIGSTTHIETQPVRNTDPDAPFPYRLDAFEEDQPLISPVMLYWMMVGLSVAATVVISPFVFGMGITRPTDFIAGGFVAVMILPALQLVASVKALLVVAIFFPERSYALRRLGRITLWSFAGTMLGSLLMGGCFGLLLVAK